MNPLRMHSKYAIIPFGLPGCGKTTYLKNHVLKWFKPATYISADDIKTTLEGYDPANPEPVHQQSVALAEQKVYDSISVGENIVFDSGSINTRYSKRIFERLHNAGYRIILYFFDVPLDVCLERNKKREFTVPESAIIKKNEEAPQALYNLMPYISTIMIVRG